MVFAPPSEAAFDLPTVCVELNRTWVGYIMGAFDREFNRDSAWSGDENAVYDVRQEVEKLLEAFANGNCIMIGDIKLFAGELDDERWLLCDGSVVSETTYADLFALIGDTYAGITPPAGMFFLPDLRGRAPIGAGHASGLTDRDLGAKVGAETHILITAELATHSHGVSQTDHAHTMVNPHAHSVDVRQNATAFGDGLPATSSNNNVNSTRGINGTNLSMNGAQANITINDQGSSNPHNNMQPSLAINYYIRAK